MAIRSGRHFLVGLLTAVFIYVGTTLCQPQHSSSRILSAMDPSRAPGAFKILSKGSTHYSLVMSETGRDLVVFVHGFSGTSHSFIKISKFLNSNGFDTLCFDLHGRGYSSIAQDAEHSVSLFVGQLSELLDTLGIFRPVHLVGWSMGGAIVSDFARLHSSRVKSLSLLNSAGLPTVKPGFTDLLVLPYVGEFLINTGIMGPSTLMASFTRQVSGWESNKAALQWFYDAQLAHVHQNPALFHSLLSTLRHFPLDTMAPTFLEIGQHAYKILLLWGSDDAVCPLSNGQRMHSMMPNSELVVIPATGHCTLVEKPDEAGRSLLRFITGTSAA